MRLASGTLSSADTMPVKGMYLSETRNQSIKFIPHNPGGQIKEVEQRIITLNALAVIKLDVQ